MYNAAAGSAKGKKKRSIGLLRKEHYQQFAERSGSKKEFRSRIKEGEISLI